MFRIGDFSRLARVTIKTLHHYDEAGLLQPSHVDRQSGYRYYAASQSQTLQRILLLKDLGFALEQIRELLHADAETWASVGPASGGVAESIAADQSRLLRLTALRQTLDRSGTEPPPVVLREVPAIEVYAVRQRVPQLGAPMQALFEEAEALVAAAHATQPRQSFHDLPRPRVSRDEVDVEVCIPVKQGVTDLTTRIVPASASMGCITYHGPYEQTPIALLAITAMVGSQRHAHDGPLREVYHRYGADQIGYRLPASVLANDSAEYVTELQAPVAPLT